MSQPKPTDPTDPGLIEFEAALGSLSPTPGRIDRDRLMFLAGQAARRPSPLARWAWPAIAASLAVVSAGEAALLASRPGPRVVERLVVVRAPAPPAPPEPPAPAPAVAEGPEGPAPVAILRRSPPEGGRAIAPEPPRASGSSYADLRRRVLRFGIDALPEPMPMALLPAGVGPAPPGRSSRSELEHLLNPGEST